MLLFRAYSDKSQEKLNEAVMVLNKNLQVRAFAALVFVAVTDCP